LKVFEQALMARAKLAQLRAWAGRSFVAVGMLLAPVEDLEPTELTRGPKAADTREVVSSELSVVISRHAILRYGERTGRMMGERLQLQEITRVWPHVVVSATPPDWFHVSEDVEDGTLYASIADLLIPLVPYPKRENTFIATTVLTKVGDLGAKRSAGLKGRRTRSGNKSKRRKWSEGSRPAPWDVA
jgi:hypothetical protein